MDAAYPRQTLPVDFIKTYDGCHCHLLHCLILGEGTLQMHLLCHIGGSLRFVLVVVLNHTLIERRIACASKLVPAKQNDAIHADRLEDGTTKHFNYEDSSINVKDGRQSLPDNVVNYVLRLVMGQCLEVGNERLPTWWPQKQIKISKFLIGFESNCSAPC